MKKKSPNVEVCPDIDIDMSNPGPASAVKTGLAFMTG